MQLIETNLKWATAVEKRVLDNRANQGTHRALRDEIEELQAQNKSMRDRLARLVTKDTPL